MIDWYPPWRALSKLRAHSHGFHSVLSYQAFHWMHVCCAPSFGTVLAHHPSSANPHRLRSEYCWKKTGCSVFPSVLCLLFYHDVLLVRSQLFPSGLFPAVFSLVDFNNVHQLSFSISIYSYTTRSITQGSSNSVRTSESSAPRWTSSSADYRGLGAVKVPSTLLSLALQRVKCACQTYIETSHVHT